MKLLTLLLLTTLALADLPVHCVHHQIKGKWKLFVSEPVLTGLGVVPCGHEIPDRPDTSYSAGWNKFKSA
jgi:cathepsin C